MEEVQETERIYIHKIAIGHWDVAINVNQHGLIHSARIKLSLYNRYKDKNTISGSIQYLILSFFSNPFILFDEV